MARHLVWVRGTDGSNTVELLEQGGTTELHKNQEHAGSHEPLNIDSDRVALVSAERAGTPLYGVELLGYLQ